MKKVLTGIAAGALLLLITGYIFYFRPYYYLFNGGKIEFTPEIRKELIRSQYLQMLTHEDALYFCSREGLEKRSIDGTSEWTKPYQMLSPTLKNAGDYFVVADILGHDAFIFHKSGFMANVRENLPIISAWINDEGQIALILESDLENRIKIYGKDGVPLIERGSVLSQDGYPVALALSDDGIHMVTSYADAFNGKLETKVTMFGFADYHEDLDEFIVRADVYENELIPELHYFGAKSLWVIGNRQAHIYPMASSKEIYAQPKHIEMQGDIEQVYYTKNEVLVYSDTKEIGVSRYRLKVYHYDGELTAEYHFADSPQLITVQGENYFIINQEKIFKYRGAKMIWEYPFYERLEGFHEISTDRYLLIKPMGYTVWKLKQMY
ncbi:hypothetical protein EII17_04935 [Clostridiales bacterium COT073_COT-073]|nr:hypothetical protein EII17_04935 [Clostridiales bacterium COT073_COT-073]